MDFKNKVLTSVIIFGLLIVIIAAYGVYTFSPKKIDTVSSEKNTIYVDGKSELTFPPELARVRGGVSISKKTAKEAQEESNNITVSIINVLLEKGISKEDIETESVILEEDKTWAGNSGYMTIGWKSTQYLKIKTKNLSSVGMIVDTIVNNNGNQINSIDFYLSSEKEKEYKQITLEKATKSAKEKAETIAKSLDVELGNIISVSESNFNYIPYNYQLKNNAGIKAIEESATIMPKDVTVNAEISLVYEIKNKK